MSKVPGHACQKLLGAIDVQNDQSAAWTKIRSGLDDQSVCRVGFVNAHALRMACEDAMFLHNILNCNVLLEDGAGIHWALQKLQLQKGVNMNGTDFIPFVLDQCPGMPVYLFGTREPYLSRAAAHIASCHGNPIVRTAHGFSDPSHYISILEEHALASVQIVVLGMGMPVQEALAEAIALRWSRPEARLLILNGGGILDFMSGRVPRAPVWIQRCKCEWLFRMVQEPARLHERYVRGGLRFIRYVRAAARMS